MAVSEGISRSATALTDNAAMVKKTVFPIETLVLSVVLAAVVNQVIALRDLRRLSRSARAPRAALAAAGRAGALPSDRADIRPRLPRGHGATFVRDAVPVVGIALTVLFYTTPIVYPAELVPARLRFLVQANPFAHLTAWYRDAFTLHRMPEAARSSSRRLLAAAVLAAGASLFRRARPHFADLIARRRRNVLAIGLLTRPVSHVQEAR